LGPLGLSGFGPSALTSALAITGWIAVGMAAGLLLIRLSGLHTEYSEFIDDDDDDEDELEGDSADAFGRTCPEPIADDIVSEDEPR
jgi:hypothetical protein